MTLKVPLTLSLIASACLLLTGCVQTTVSGHTQEQAANDNAQIQLAEAAISVSDSLGKLAAIKAAEQPTTKMSAPPKPASIGMSQLATTDWTGPIEPLLKKIAAATKYRLQVIGHKPSIPVIVSVYAKNEPLATILRDASFQAASKVDVVVYPRRKIIEMRYLNM